MGKGEKMSLRRNPEIGDRVYVFREDSPDAPEGWAIVKRLYLPNVEIQWEETLKTAVVTLSDLHEEDPYP